VGGAFSHDGCGRVHNLQARMSRSADRRADGDFQLPQLHRAAARVATIPVCSRPTRSGECNTSRRQAAIARFLGELSTRPAQIT